MLNATAPTSELTDEERELLALADAVGVVVSEEGR